VPVPVAGPAPITINGRNPNLFRGLLSYRPRPERDSRENFLTESFAYVLATNPAMATKVVEAIVEHQFQVKRLVGISTQVSLHDETSRGLPDMMIEVVAHDDREVRVWIENKWGACADPDQLARYVRYIKRNDRDVQSHLVLLTPRHTDAKLCRIPKATIRLTHMSWSKLQEVVAANATDALAREFEAFLTEKRLTVRSISLAAVREHYRRLQSEEDRSESRLREDLWILSERVFDTLAKTEFSEDAYIIDNYGRVGFWMYGSRITLALLHDPTDHCSAFVDESQPLDVIVRLEGKYTKADSETERTKFAPLVRALEKAGYACDQGRWRANAHTMVLGHYREGFPFDRSPDDQVQWVLDVFNSTLDLLTKDRKLVTLLRSVRGYG
jgi:hypothetical protein